MDGDTKVEQPHSPVEVPRESDNSEDYDSAEGDSSYSEEDGGARPRSRASEGASEGDAVEGITERQSGDGQESTPNKKVDHDEDKKNPQYIPKRGTFYEHDDRTLEEPEEKEAEEAEKIEKDPKKKVWADKKERWSHDRFNDSEQAPKSKSELIAIYGYDIRNEDGPPRARRRRRYGRGPNKYTRNWKDEDAYTKPPAPVPKVHKTTTIVTKSNKNIPEEIRNEPIATAQQNSRNEVRKNVRNTNDNERIPKRNSIERNEPAEINESQNRQNAVNANNSPANQSMGRAGSGRVVTKPRREIKDSDYRGFTARGQQIRNIRGDQQRILPPKSKKDDFVQSQNFTNTTKSQHAPINALERDMSKLNVQEGVYRGPHPQHSGPSNSNDRQGSVPPRLQNEAKGPKRYSSMRQRSLPETAAPPPPAGGGPAPGPAFPHSFYPTDYDSTAPPPPSQAPIMVPGAIQQAPPLPIPTQAPPPAVLAPPQFAAAPFGAGPPPSFIQPAAAPPQFIPTVNYPQQLVAGVAAVPAGFQGYQQQFNPVTQPAELYQPQGGITYYSAEQQLALRAVPTKRPKAAIPIVAPEEAVGGAGMVGAAVVQAGSAVSGAETHEE